MCLAIGVRCERDRRRRTRRRPAHRLAAIRSAHDIVPLASSGTTRARGRTTRATGHCGASGAPTTWNPVFVTPVFTALEYGAFRAFGVGTWQARVVPVASGLAAVALPDGGPSLWPAGVRPSPAGSLLATNYVFVMWNRAALIESTMVAFMVVSWAAYAMSGTPDGFGAAAGVAAAFAWFTKAAAAFFVAAIVLDACWSWWAARSSGGPDAARGGGSDYRRCRVGARTAGRGVFRGAELERVRVLQLADERDCGSRNTRCAPWSTARRGFRSCRARSRACGRLWWRGMIGLLAVALRWRAARRAGRLLALWVILGLAELVVHDSGNERRYLMFVPPSSPSPRAISAAVRPTTRTTQFGPCQSPRKAPSSPFCFSSRTSSRAAAFE